MPVIAASRDVTTDVDRLRDTASWLAYEELPFPVFFCRSRSTSPGRDIDFVLVANLLNFAYTDFDDRCALRPGRGRRHLRRLGRAAVLPHRALRRGSTCSTAHISRA